MGLSIEVGSLVELELDEEDGETDELEGTAGELHRVRALLQKQGLPTWDEPKASSDALPESHVDGFPYEFLHCLRRAYAWAVERPGVPLTPLEEDGLSGQDEVLVENVAMRMDSHLLCHSDAEGYYVPVDFPEPLGGSGKVQMPGGVLGSSQALLRELQRVAPLLGIVLSKDGTLSEDAAERLSEEADSEGPFYREQVAWLALYEAVQFSLAHQSAIVFR